MINPKDIRENGKAICDFLELRIVDKRARKNPRYSIPFSTIAYLEYDHSPDPSVGIDTYVPASDTLFHSNWTWLMPVVKKCYILASDTDMEDVFDAGTNHELYMNEIDKVYEACVEFIKWYNDNTNK